jgi:branched-chain amino acid transport system ATP-binding protein
MRAVMKICDRIVVINFGRKIAEGFPQEVKRNKDVIEAYLGVGENAA